MRAARYKRNKDVFMEEVLDKAKIEPTEHTHLSNFAPTDEEEEFYDTVVRKVRSIWGENIKDMLERPLPKIIHHLAGNG
jgi:hypothetical protein